MKESSKFYRLVLAALICCGLLALPAAAQTNRGAITGTVVDPAGAAVPNARVSARNTETGVTIEAEATDEGLYRIQQAPAGTYTVTVTAPGFRTTEVADVLVEVSNTTSRDIALEVGTEDQTVNVSAEGAITVASDT